jgi:hypothetical protein
MKVEINKDFRELYNKAVQSTSSKSPGGIEITDNEIKSLEEIAKKSDGNISVQEREFINSLKNKINVAKISAIGESKSNFDLELRDDDKDTTLPEKEIKERFQYLARQTGTDNLLKEDKSVLKELAGSDKISSKDFKALVDLQVSSHIIFTLSENEMADAVNISNKTDGKLDTGYVLLFNKQPGLLKAYKEGKFSDEEIKNLAKSYTGTEDRLTIEQLKKTAALIKKFAVDDNGNLDAERGKRVINSITQDTKDLGSKYSVIGSTTIDPQGDKWKPNEIQKNFSIALLEKAGKNDLYAAENFLEIAMRGGDITLRPASDKTPVKVLSEQELKDIMKDGNLLKVISHMNIDIPSSKSDTGFEGYKEKVEQNNAVVDFIRSDFVTKGGLQNTLKSISDPVKKEIYLQLLDIKTEVTNPEQKNTEIKNNSAEIFQTFKYLEQTKISNDDIKEIIKNQANAGAKGNDILAAIQGYGIIQEALAMNVSDKPGITIKVPNYDNLVKSAQAIKDGKIFIDSNTKTKFPSEAMYQDQFDVVRRRDFDINSNDNKATLLHELTHSAQDIQFENTPKDKKPKGLETELEAYLAQNLYLEKKGEKPLNPTFGKYVNAYKEVQELAAIANPSEDDKNKLKAAKENMVKVGLELKQELLAKGYYDYLDKPGSQNGINHNGHNHFCSRC